LGHEKWLMKMMIDMCVDGILRRELVMGQDWGAYRKEKNCRRKGKEHDYVWPRSGKRTYKICFECQSHKTLKKARRR